MQFCKKLAVAVAVAGLFGPRVMAQSDSFSAEGSEYLPSRQIPLISVASGIEEKITQAPGSVKVFGEAEIRRLGYYTLDELAGITSGYGQRQGQRGRRSFEVRGIPAGEQTNENVMVLIDGIPVHRSLNYRTYVENEMSLYSAKRVEFLKGPSSVLYGTNAMLGVVNIETKNLDDQGTLLETLVTGASPDSQKRLLVNYAMRTNMVQFKLFGSYFDKKDSREKFIDGVREFEGAAAHISRLADARENWSLNTSLEFVDESNIFSGLKIGLIHMNNEDGVGPGVWHYVDHTKVKEILKDKNTIYYVTYSKNLSDDLSMKLQYRGQKDSQVETYGQGHSYPAWISMKSDYTSKKHDYLGEIKYQFDEKTNLIFGAHYEVLGDKKYQDILTILDLDDGSLEWFGLGTGSSGSTYHVPFTSGPQVKLATTHLYTQFKHQFPVFDGLNIIGGLRWSDGSKGHDFEKTAPLIGFVQQFNDEFAFKARFGTGLKSPTIAQIKFNENVTINELPVGASFPGIDPEKITTYEGSLVYYANDFSAGLTYFSKKYENLIQQMTSNVERRTGGFANYFGNSADEIKSKGFEVEADYSIGTGKVFANATFQDSEDRHGDRIGTIPTTKLNTGLIYEWEDYGLSSSLVVKHVGDYQRNKANVAGFDAVSLARQGEKADGWTTLDLNLIKSLGDNARIGFQVKNLFDKDYNFPYLRWDEVYDIPQPDRTYLLSVNLSL